MGNLSARLVVSLVNNFSGPAKRIAADAKKLQTLQGSAAAAGAAIGKQTRRIDRAASRTGTVATGAALLGGLFIKRAYDFDKASKFVEGTANAQAGQMEALRDEIVRLAEVYPLTRSQLVEGAKEFITAGNSIDVTRKALEDLARGALASQQSVGKVGADVTDVVAGFYGKINDPEEYARRTRKILDLMAVGATAANHTWQEQTLAMQYSVPVARALGLSLEQLVASLGVLADNGFKGEKGGSALRTILLNLAAPTKAARAAFKSLGLEMDKALSFSKAKAYDPQGALAQLSQRFGVQGDDVGNAVRGVLGNKGLQGDLPAMREALLAKLQDVMQIDQGDLPSMEALTSAIDAHFAGAMENLNLDYVFEKLAKATAGQMKDITGVRRTPQLISLARGFTDQYLPKLQKITEEALGATEKRMNVFLSGFAADMDRVVSALDSLSATIEASGVVKDISAFAESLRAGMIAMKETNPQLLRFGMNSLLVLGVLGPLGMLLSGLGGILTIIGASARIAAIAIGFMGRMATIGLAQLAVAGVVGGWQLLAGAIGAARLQVRLMNMEVAAGNITRLGAMAALITPKWAGVAGIFRGVGAALRFAFVATGVGAVVTALAAAGTFIWNNWSGLGEFFTGIGQGFLEGLGPARPLAEGIASALGAVWGWITDLTGPLDASKEEWRSWGKQVGEYIAYPLKLLGEAYALLTNNQLTRALGLSTDKKDEPAKAVKKADAAAAPTGKAVADARSAPASPSAAPVSTGRNVDPAELQAALARLDASAAAVPGKVRQAMGQAKAIVDAVDLTSSGQKIIQSLANGILQGIPQITAAMTAAANEVKAHVPQSPARKGPLRGLSGAGIISEIAKGMDAGPMVGAMHRAAEATRKAANDNAGRFNVSGLQRTAAAGLVAASTLASPAAAGPASIGDIHVQVSVNGSNASPEKIGDEVGRRVRSAVRETYSDGGI